METIPGSALTAATHPPPPPPNDKPNLNLPAWAREKRWAEFPGGRPAVISPARAAAVQLKRVWAKSGLDLSRCVSGDELVAAHARGSLAPYPLRRGGKYPPEVRGELVAYKLRGARLELLGLFVRVMLSKRWNAIGVVATHDELAACLGIGRDRVGQILHDLRAWGLVHQEPTFVPLGEVTSRRGNAYRVTKACVYVFDLELDAGALPDAEPDVAPRVARAVARGNALRRESQKTTCHPETSSTQKSSDEQTARVLGAPALISKVSTSSTNRCRTAVPNESIDASEQREAREDETCGAAFRLFKPESATLASRPIADTLRRVRHGDVYDGPRPSADREQHRRDEQRRAELARQLEQLKRDKIMREERERRDGPADVPPPSDADAPRGDDRELAEARRAELERVRRERDEFSHVQPPVGGVDHDDFDEVLKRAQESWERTRWKRMARPAKRFDGGGES